MMQVQFTPFPTLETERLHLRELTHDDTRDFFQLRSDDRMMRFIGRPKPREMAEITKLIQDIRDMIAGNNGIGWVISLKGDRRMLGNISFHRMLPEHYRAEIGYMIHPDQWGKGLVQEAVRAVLDYGWKVMGLHSVYANTDPRNTASHKVLEKTGFVKEGYLKENFYYNGEFWDTVLYGIVVKK